MRIKGNLILAAGLTLILGATTRTHAIPPIVPSITAVHVASVTVSWGIPGGADGYIVEASSFPGFTGALITSTTFNNLESTLTVVGLSPNTTVYLQAGSLHTGSATDYTAVVPPSTMTRAMVPGTPTFTNTSTGSVTVQWSISGNPNYTLYEVSKSTVASFAAAISTPIPFAANFTGNTTNFTGLTPASTYYFRVRASNGLAFFTPVSAVGNVVTLSTSGGANGSGTGTASIVPANISGGDVLNTTITFIVPASGMTTGGRLEIVLPPGLGGALNTTNPNQSGYVQVVSTAGSFTVTPSTSQNVFVYLTSGNLGAGTQIKIGILNLYTSCGIANQAQMLWTVKSAMGNTSSLASISAQPVQNNVPGPARWLSYVPWSILNVASGQPSLGLVIQLSDMCGFPAVTGSSITVNLAGLMPNGSNTTDPSATFSTSSSFATTTTFVGIPAASSSTVFYYKTSTLGNNLSIRSDYQSPYDNSNQNIWRTVNVLSAGFSFNNPSVDNGTAVSGQTSMTLSPNGDGINDLATIRFAPSDTSLQWRVVISSNGFQNLVFDRWGSGNPQSSLNWDGRDYSGRVVSTGTYAVRLEVPGFAEDTSLSITVNAASISGRVTLGGSPLARAWVNANRTTGAGYSFAETDSNGDYTLNGLISGGVYNLFLNYQSSTTQANIGSQMFNVTAPAANKDFALALPAVVRVSAVLPSTSPTMNFGSLNIFTTNYTQNYWGNVRILPGNNASDNGDSFNSSTWTIMGVPPGAYRLRLQMPGFDVSEQPITVSAGQTLDVVINLTTRASVFGKITISSSSVSQWVSVQGTLLGANYPTIHGGAYFDVGTSTAVYSLFGVSAGTYSFVAQAPGYAPLKSTGVIVGAANLGDPVSGGGVNFAGFSTGGKITGSITVNGDTSDLTFLTLWINAFSQQLGQNAFTQVQLSTHPTVAQSTYTLGGLADGTYQIFPPYLNGFEASPPGQQSVTVAGGNGTLNIVLSKNTGAIGGTISLGGQTNYNQVHLSLQGPNGQEIDLPNNSTYTIHGLNTGYYRLVATYRTTGAQMQTPVAVTNGQLTPLNINLGTNTFGILGNVSVQSAFTMLNTTGAVVTISTMTDLMDAATTQVLTIGGMPTYSGTSVQCSGGTNFNVSTVRVEAFPKNFNSYGQANRSGLANCFGVGEYRYGAVGADGSYSIAGLTPGLWEISVYPYLDGTNSPSVGVLKQVVSITGSTVSGVNFGLSQGSNISGTLTLPAGSTDWRTFNVDVVTDRGDTVQSTTLQVGAAGTPAASATFSIPNLAAGKYALVIRDFGSYDPVLNRMVIKYVAKPVQVEITGSDVTGIDVQLKTAGRVVGSLSVQGANPDGTPAQTLITSSNINLLPDNFRVFAQANPWVPSGYAEATRQSMGPRIAIDSNNQFSIDGLIAGTYDVIFRQDSWGASIQGQGSLNIAATTKGGVIIAQGQTLDLGTITLKPGVSISGGVTDTNGSPLSNILVRAYPSNSQHGREGQEVFTNATGQFTFTGLSPDVRIYDFIAAPRPDPQSNFQAAPYGESRRLAVDISTVPAPTMNFTLVPALASLTGQVVTVDNGALGWPGDQNQGYPAAAVYVKLQSAKDADNPLGDESATSLSGAFNITNLPAGVYDITVQSLGYRPYRLTGVTLTNSAHNLGTITLQTGPSLTVTLAKPDGSAVTGSDVDTAVAASADLNSIIFGQVNKDAQTGNILSIKFAGFELSPKTYSVLLFDDRDNILVPPEGRNFSFTSATDAATKSLTFQPSAPVAIAHVQKSGTDVLVTFYLSRPVRNGPGDQDPTTFLTRTSGSGTLSSISLSGDRRQLSATYTPTAGEQNATLAFSASSVDVDPATGQEFVISKSVTLLLGQKATAEQSINSALGGEVSLSDSLDPSNVTIPANALLGSDGAAADPTATYAFTFAATDDASQVGASALAGAPRVAGMMSRGPSAYISEAYAAMQVARAQSVNPLSSFYSVLLPAGISHTLHETATLTLNYDSSADPNLINVYFFNGTHYILENYQRVVDTTNRTITVGVRHFSTFVVMQNSLPVITVSGDSSSAGDITVFNFPNPFNLQSKTKTLNHGGSSTDITTEGTIIRYTIPAAKLGPASIEIYNIVGEKVRTLTLGVPTADTFNYIEWDGRNHSGNKVASGVYIGQLKVGSEIKSFKMAVIK